MNDENRAPAPAAYQPEQPKHHCPDPTKPFTKYLIDTAVAKKESDLYAEDVTQVQPRYEKLKGAQTRYADAKKAQKTAYEELERRIERIKENLHCSLKESERDELIRCWKDLLDQTKPPYDYVNCRPIDQQDPDDLPETRPELTELLDDAVKCRDRADLRFDRLIKVPEDLAATITALAARAAALEQAIVAAPKEMLRRHYVEYLELNKDFEAVEADWIDPTKYGCKLKRFFAALLKRHILVIAVRVAIERLDQYDKKSAEENAEKKNNLIDFVLECATPEPSKPGEYQPSPPPKDYQQSAPAPAPHSAHQTAADDDEEV